MTEPVTPADLAAAIAAARDRLVAVAAACTDEVWRAPLSAADLRPVGVVVDHVGHAYEYCAAWMRDLLSERSVEVSGEVVDALNEKHAATATEVTREQALERLRRSGDAVVALVSGLSAADMDVVGGRVRRFATISIRHADGHREQIEAVVAASAG